MADVAVEGATEGVWHNLFLEVDKVALHQHIFLSYLADLDLRPRIFNHQNWTRLCTLCDMQIKKNNPLHLASIAHVSLLAHAETHHVVQCMQV